MKKLIFILFIFFKICSNPSNLPSVIILNGSPSAGKSSIAKQLQILYPNFSIVSYDLERVSSFVSKAKSLKLIPENYVCTNLLVFFEDIRKSLKNISDKKTIKEWRTFIDSFDDEFYENINQLALKGKKIIVDTIIFDDKQIKSVKKIEPKNLFTVFIHASLEKIIERINKRNSYNDSQEMRFANRILFFYPNYYKAKLEADELTFKDCISLNRLENIILNNNSLTETAFPTGNKLLEHFIKSLEINDVIKNNNVFLVPKYEYDFVVDTSDISIEEVSLAIRKALDCFNNSESKIYAKLKGFL